jgi:hypothetical protein
MNGAAKSSTDSKMFIWDLHNTLNMKPKRTCSVEMAFIFTNAKDTAFSDTVRTFLCKHLELALPS